MAGLTVYTKLLDKTLEGARIIDMCSFFAGTSYQGTEAWIDEEGKKYPKEWWK